MAAAQFVVAVTSDKSRLVYCTMATVDNNSLDKSNSPDDPIQTIEGSHSERNDHFDCVLAKKIGTDFSYKRKIVWSSVFTLGALHALGIYGLKYSFTNPGTFGFCLFVGYLGASLGVPMGAHRHFTHRSFKANQWIRLALLLAFTLTGQNSLWEWVRDHRQHHKYSDTDADPHNATRSFFFSHVGWLMTRKHPKVIEYGKKIDMSDLDADPLIMLHKK